MAAKLQETIHTILVEDAKANGHTNGHVNGTGKNGIEEAEHEDSDEDDDEEGAPVTAEGEGGG